MITILKKKKTDFAEFPFLLPEILKLINKQKVKPEMWILLLDVPEVILVNLCYSMCKNEWRGVKGRNIHVPPAGEMMHSKRGLKNAVNN